MLAPGEITHDTVVMGSSTPATRQRWNHVIEIDHGRRRFLGTAAMTIAAARLGVFGRLRAGGALASVVAAVAAAGTADTNERVPRELAALGGAAEWLNSPRLTSSSLAGKVVIVDFWTYTCINWLRTLPYVRAWARKYREALVIGVHTPEFAFERNIDNVRRAVRQMKIEYPVAIDSDYASWRAFKNQYWPALYFIDARGRVRDHHFGEGAYQRSETAIQRLLAEAGIAGLSDGGFVSVDADGIEAAADWDNLKSPETYVGYDRTETFASRGGADLDRRRVYAASAGLALNQWALAGEWTMGKQAVLLSSPGRRIVHRFHARDLHLVMGPSSRGILVRFRVSIDGQAPGPAHGLDVDDGGNGTVVEQRLYQLIRQPKPIADRTFEIAFLDAGVEAFAFTFG
jgi:thiol-disulfide isomerase/thioredoxin